MPHEIPEWERRLLNDLDTPPRPVQWHQVPHPAQVQLWRAKARAINWGVTAVIALTVPVAVWLWIWALG